MQTPDITNATTEKLDLQRVMREADRRYAEMVGSPLHHIESRQVKALAASVVLETNRVLSGLRNEYQGRLNRLGASGE